MCKSWICINVIESEEERVRVLKDAFGLTKKVLAISTIEPRRSNLSIIKMGH